jgi:sugar lactone lactonase YvrE
VATIVSFDPAAGQFPEGIAVDKRGTVYVTLITPRSQLIAIDPNGQQRLVATLPGTTVPGPIGLAVDPQEDVYVAVSSDATSRGVYRVTPQGDVLRLPGTEAISAPNGLAFDQRGALFVTNSLTGDIWRIARGGSAELWLDAALLEGTGANAGFPVGANGIAYDHGTLYVANFDTGTIVTVPIRPDGSPGEPTAYASGSALVGSDGIAFDVHGDLYVANFLQSTVVRIGRDGSIATLATAADGLDNPSSIAFGTGRGHRQTLYVANFALIPNVSGAPPAPGVVGLDVGVPGRPLP